MLYRYLPRDVLCYVVAQYCDHDWIVLGGKFLCVWDMLPDGVMLNKRKNRINLIHGDICVRAYKYSNEVGELYEVCNYDARHHLHGARSKYRAGVLIEYTTYRHGLKHGLSVHLGIMRCILQYECNRVVRCDEYTDARLRVRRSTECTPRKSLYKSRTVYHPNGTVREYAQYKFEASRKFAGARTWQLHGVVQNFNEHGVCTCARTYVHGISI